MLNQFNYWSNFEHLDPKSPQFHWMPNTGVLDPRKLPLIALNRVIRLWVSSSLLNQADFSILGFRLLTRPPPLINLANELSIGPIKSKGMRIKVPY